MNINWSKYQAVLRLAKRHWFKVMCGVGVFYLLFCGDYSLLSIVSLRTQEASLRHEIKVYNDSISNYEQRLREVQADNEQLERFAREKMKMLRENEDLYLIDE